MPKKICIQCEQDVNIFNLKLKRFRQLEVKWCDILKKEQPNHPYLELVTLFDVSSNHLLLFQLRNYLNFETYFFRIIMQIFKKKSMHAMSNYMKQFNMSSIHSQTL